MGSHTFTTHIAAPVEVVFDLWTNLPRMKEWVGGVTRVSGPTGPMDQAGTRYSVFFGGMESRTEVIDAERPKRFATRFGNRILRGTNATRFEPDGGGTRLTQTFRTEGLIAGLMVGCSPSARTRAASAASSTSSGELRRPSRCPCPVARADDRLPRPPRTPTRRHPRRPRRRLEVGSLPRRRGPCAIPAAAARSRS